MKLNAAVVSIGDELVSGVSIDTNSAWLSQQLAAVGIETHLHLTVADDLARIVAAIRQAVADAAGGCVLITGGLGPTEDDLTRQALAEAMGERLVEDAGALEQIEAFFKKVSRPMAASNRLQALKPESAAILVNTNGTAPGLRAKIGETEIFVMPGVPREMKEMFTRSILPILRDHLAAINAGHPPQVRRVTKLNTYGTGESVIGEKIKDLMVRGGFSLEGAHVSVGTTAADGIVSVRIYASGGTEQADAAIESVRSDVKKRLGAIVYGEELETLEQALGVLLKENRFTIATAESCTGGLIAAMLTNVAGSSEYFLRGWVTYANQAKIDELNVAPELLERYGAVSEEVARAMAEGARRHAGTTLAISTTGIAGPGGGTTEKPVGTVWFGLAGPDGTMARRHVFSGDRAQVRQRAAQMALAMLRWKLLNENAPA